MPKFRYLVPFFALGLVACGGETKPPQASDVPVLETTATAQPSAVDQSATVTKAEAESAAQTAKSNRLAAAAAKTAELRMRGVRELGWEELMPEGEEERLAELYQSQMAMLYSGGPIAEGSAGDVGIQIGTFNTVKELNGVKIRLPGYTVPFDFGANAEIKEFLLVPYYGACLHAPPPPPNQTVFVMTDTPIKLKDLAQAVWIEGTLYTQTQESELADAAYTIKMDSVEVYEY